ncbi:hypothetical protein A4A49_62488, partial [Nicotiana attenuata]
LVNYYSFLIEDFCKFDFSILELKHPELHLIKWIYTNVLFTISFILNCLQKLILKIYVSFSRRTKLFHPGDIAYGWRCM